MKDFQECLVKIYANTASVHKFRYYSELGKRTGIPLKSAVA